MNQFVIIIEVLVAGAVLFGMLQMYFTINKIWKQRNERSVAESISIYEKFLRIIVGIPLLIKFSILDQNFSPAIDISITALGSLLLLLIGMGLWVQGNQNESLWTLLIHALKLENRDTSHLIKSFLQPKKADQVLELLINLACIDNELDKKEIQIIQKFAEQWNLQMPEYDVEHLNPVTIIDLRESMVQYLSVQPPNEQAGQLLDMIKLIIHVDGKVTKEEDLIFQELGGLINSYISRDNHTPQRYKVLLVPQQDRHIKKIQTILPQKSLTSHRGGQAFLAGSFYSKEYAQEICQYYIEQDVVAVWCLDG